MTQIGGSPATADRRGRLVGFLSLFTSFGTLVCCALPSILVLAGLGATVASVLSAAPWLVALSHHKRMVFGVSGALIAANVVYVYRLAPALRWRTDACPPESPGACATADRFSRVVLWLSVVVYAAGFFTAFILGPILTAFD